MIEREETVETADGPMSVVIRHPDGDGPFPVVVVYHDGPGVRGDIHDITRRLVDEGYYTVLPDLYHRLGRFITFDMAGVAEGPGSPEFTKLIEAVESLQDEKVLDDTARALDLVASDGAATLDRKAAMGFCMGARFTLRLLASDPDGYAAGSAMHPSACVTDEPDSPHRSVNRIGAELYVGLGAADVISPLEVNRPLCEELENIEAIVEVFDGADHGFMFPNYPSYQEYAAEVSWDRTLELFGRTLSGVPTR
jgi:carboxymethylenebutenolidase